MGSGIHTRSNKVVLYVERVALYHHYYMGSLVHTDEVILSMRRVGDARPLPLPAGQELTELT